MDFNLLTAIIEAYKTYQLGIGVNQKRSINDFAVWVNQQVFKKEKINKIPGKKNAEQCQLEVEINTLMIGLNRYSKLLIKKD